MSRKTRILSLSVVGACGFTASGFAVSSASAQILAGNVMPNPSLNNYTATPPPGDPSQMYSGSLYGDIYTRPVGWHRGGGDFVYATATYDPTYNPAMQPPPAFDLYAAPLPPFTGQGTMPAPNPYDPTNLYALEVNDTSTSGYGEWYSDYNPLPAQSQLTGTPFELQFFVYYTNLTTTKSQATDEFRVSTRWGVAGTNYTSDLGGGPDFAMAADYGTLNNSITAPLTSSYTSTGQFGTATITTTNDAGWIQVDEMITPPTDASTMGVTIDSGGSSAATGQIWVQDISMAYVPEPASLFGITAGSMLLLAKRRRRA